MAEPPEVIGLLHRADWTRLSLSAEVRFESGRAALLIAPGGHYRMEHQDEGRGGPGERRPAWLDLVAVWRVRALSGRGGPQ